MGRAQQGMDDKDLDNAIYEILRSENVPPALELKLFPKLKRLYVEHGGQVQAKKVYEVIARELRALKLN